MSDIEKMLAYAALSYKDFQPFDGSDRIICIDATKIGVQYYIRISGEKMYISFRGSDSVSDAAVDAVFFKKEIPFCTDRPDVKVHRGFLYAYTSSGIRDRIHYYITDEIK